jgi:hypothetical protein
MAGIDNEAAMRPLRQAAAAADASAMTEVTRFPFLFEGQRLDREAFVARAVPALFTPAVRRCLRSAPPKPEDGRLVLWCKPYAFYLERDARDGLWRIAEFAADTP